MKRVLLLTAYDQDGTYFYRQQPLFNLSNAEMSIQRKPYYGEIGYSFFDGFDILFMERPSGVNDLHVIKLAKQCGLKVITDWDDDVLHLDSYNPMWHHYEENKKTVMECISLSDDVWVSTDGLKKSFKLLNRNIHVIPNAHNDYIHSVQKKKAFNPDTKKAIWRGGSSHEADVYEVSNVLINRINDNQDWQFQFIGFRFIYMEQRCGDNYLPVSQMPLMQYFEYLQKENPNIVFHPLCNTKFNESKSNIAWLEATYAGAAFFGNKGLPEFNHISINAVKTDITKVDHASLKIANELAWDYILENLLLSKVNLLRTERILAL